MPDAEFASRTTSAAASSYEGFTARRIELALREKIVSLEIRPGTRLSEQEIADHYHVSRQTNRSNDRRIALAVRYIPTHVRQVAINDDSAALVRGTDRYGHFRHEPRPVRDMEPDLVSQQQAAAARQTNILYAGTGRTSLRADL